MRKRAKGLGNDGKSFMIPYSFPRTLCMLSGSPLVPQKQKFGTNWLKKDFWTLLNQGPISIQQFSKSATDGEGIRTAITGEMLTSQDLGYAWGIGSPSETLMMMFV